MSVYVTIDLDSLMCKLSDKELYDFMLETFRDRVSDESHVSLITEMFKVMFDTDQEDALAKMVANIQKRRPKQVSPVWVSVKDRLPPVDKEVVVLTKDEEICFGHIVDKKIAKSYNGWNIPDVEYWLPFVDPSTVCQFTGLKDKNGTPIYEWDIVIYKDNNAERRGDINWDSKAAAFCFGQGFLVNYPSENMVVIGNEFDKEE